MNDGNAKNDKIKAILKSNVMLIILVLLLIVFGIMSKNFLTFKNLMNICTQNAYFIIASIGVAMIMISRRLRCNFYAAGRISDSHCNFTGPDSWRYIGMLQWLCGKFVKDSSYDCNFGYYDHVPGDLLYDFRFSVLRQLSRCI